MKMFNRAYTRTMTALQRRLGVELDPDAGLTTVEWGLITGGVAAVAIGAVVVFGDKVAALMNAIPGG